MNQGTRNEIPGIMRQTRMLRARDRWPWRAMPYAAGKPRSIPTPTAPKETTTLFQVY